MAFASVVLLFANAAVLVLNVQLPEVEARAERYACGARSAYVALQLSGVDADYERVCDLAPPRKEGCTIGEVEQAILYYGVHCEVRRLELSDLPSVPCPCIMHTVPKHGRATGDPDPSGHFVVVTSVDEIGLHTLDPLTNLERHWAWDSFSDQFNGYAVLLAGSSPVRTSPVLWGLALVNLLLAAGGLLHLIAKSMLHIRRHGENIE